MPRVRKLSADEVEQLRRRGARVDLTPYLADLSILSIGDWGLIELKEGDKVPTIKRRYTVAANEQGKKLVYKRRRIAGLPFEVREAGTGPVVQPQTPVPPELATPLAARARRGGHRSRS